MPNSTPSEPTAEAEAGVLANAAALIDEYRRSTRLYLIVYRTLKMLEVLTAAAIPTFAAVGNPDCIQSVMAILGGLIVVFQGAQALFRPQDVWVMCRLTLSELTRERRLYTANAGRYSKLSTIEATNLFAERLEEILQEFDSRWQELRDPRKAREMGASKGAPMPDAK